MAKPTHDEIIRELTRDIALLNVQVVVIEREMNARADFPIRLALLEQRIEDMRESTMAWAMRVWAVVGPILGAAIGAALTWYLNKH